MARILTPVGQWYTAVALQLFDAGVTQTDSRLVKRDWLGEECNETTLHDGQALPDDVVGQGDLENLRRQAPKEKA